MGEQQKKTLAEEVVELLKVDELTVTTAESCTGGLVAARLVDVPGVSEVFKQGFITYSNKAKRKLLNVKKTTLKEFGAVSEKTAREMAKGAILASGADAAIATTGIAGPDGGTEEKPVGLVYIGVSVRGQMYVEEYHFEGERSEVRESTVQAALALLKKYQIIEPLDGMEELDFESRLLIYPSVSMVLLGDDARSILNTFGEDRNDDDE